MPDLFRHPPRRKLCGMREREPSVCMMASGYRGTIYTGATSNLIGRVMQHRDGTFDGFTMEHDVKRLVWFETADTMEPVIATERKLKKWRRAWKVALIEEKNPHWSDLAVELGLPPLDD